MSRLIHLSFVLALLACLTGPISANPIDDDRERLNQLLSNPEPADDAELLRNTQEAIALYKKHASRTLPGHQVELDLDRDIRAFETEHLTVDGLPIQGGVWDLIKRGADKVPDEVKDQAKELAKTTAKVLFNKLTEYLKKKISGEDAEKKDT
uniref:Protein Turandot Z n=1 Tax=Drosophila pseudoobscura pseudoobscura TaxID=46245 RepID=TOTZ_DROPS|nr:RecName: Full=Protein Turandot Z; Flags: Precursor [Drosophila pseudoobscura pseudoobscura]